MNESKIIEPTVKVPSVCVFIALHEDAPITASVLESLRDINYTNIFFKILYSKKTKADMEKISRLLPDAKLIESDNIIEEIQNAKDDFSLIWSPLISAHPDVIKQLLVVAIREAAAVIAPKIVHKEDEKHLFMIDGTITKDGHYLSSIYDT